MNHRLEQDGYSRHRPGIRLDQVYTAPALSLTLLPPLAATLLGKQS